MRAGVIVIGILFFVGVTLGVIQPSGDCLGWQSSYRVVELEFITATCPSANEWSTTRRSRDSEIRPQGARGLIFFSYLG
ncbi:MAG: hypothetical protein M3198_14750 [Actinomycetota bacterium]|nr:hypothetical protein [Actinomycetota bacterium]